MKAVEILGRANISSVCALKTPQGEPQAGGVSAKVAAKIYAVARAFFQTLLTALVIVLGATVNAALAATPDEWTRLSVTTSLDRPEAVAPIDNKSALIAERSGRILFVDTGGDRIDLGKISLPGMRIFYMPERPLTEGLKDLIADPTRPGTFLWCATTGSEQAVSWTVGRATLLLSAGKPSGLQNDIVWQSGAQLWTRSSPPPFMGCRMAVDGSDVIVAMGANSRAKGSGQVVRVSLLADHPSSVVSTGHRNPSGLVVLAGRIWEVEHGPKGGDELNLVTVGSNYGWPDVSQGEPDDSNFRSFLRSRQQSTDAALTWTPAIAPSSMATLGGKLYVGGLQCQCVVEVITQGETVVGQRRILEIGQRIRDVRAGLGDEALWLLTDGPAATLVRVSLN